ncbi:hypothetical protein [Micromonospora sp. SH-82]|uniref:hypothetical protein n=1 Tax=Micromonospora sp. SH-82 TaxID=3132938 RepID=UPI003EB8724C
MSFFVPKGPWRTNPGLALLHLVVWYAAVVGVYLAVAYSASDTPPPDCEAGFCLSDREQMLYLALFGYPVLGVTFLVSLVILGVRSSRDPTRPASSVGFVAAVPGFVVLAVLLCLGVTRLG